MTSTPQFKTQTVPAATPAALSSTPCRLMAVYLYGGSAASSVEFKNAATDTGTVLFSMDTVANQGHWVNLEELGGIPFSTACFCKPAGTGAIVYAWFE